MGQRLMTVSDKSGTLIPEGQGAKIRITFPGTDQVTELDFTVEEARELGKGGNSKRRPGRPPGSKNKPKDGNDANGSGA